jgi:hypothetical protein
MWVMLLAVLVAAWLLAVAMTRGTVRVAVLIGGLLLLGLFAFWYYAITQLDIA